MVSFLRRRRWTVHSMQVHESAESRQAVPSMPVYGSAWISLRSRPDNA